MSVGLTLIQNADPESLAILHEPLLKRVKRMDNIPISCDNGNTYALQRVKNYELYTGLCQLISNAIFNNIPNSFDQKFPWEIMDIVQTL